MSIRVLIVLVAVAIGLLFHLYQSDQVTLNDGVIEFADRREPVSNRSSRPRRIRLPDYSGEIDHDGHDHDLVHCFVPSQCAEIIADADSVGLPKTEEGGIVLTNVEADGPETVYKYTLPYSREEYERMIPPPAEWLNSMREDFCADELNWPMTDMGVITTQQFFAPDGELLGQVQITECQR